MADNDKAQVLAALKKNRLASLATVNAVGSPHVVIVLYVVDDDFNLYFVTRHQTRKVSNMDVNGQVAVSISQEPPFNIQVSGRAEQVRDEVLRGEKLTELAEAGAGLEDIWPPILRIGDSDYVLYRIVPEKLRALDLRSQTIAAEEPPFIEVL